MVKNRWVAAMCEYEEDLDVMQRNAEIVLNSPIFGNRISYETGISKSKIYKYRCNIKKSWKKEDLIKLNKMYHTHAFFENKRKG